MIPEGWKLVPVEPTPEMLEAAFKESVVGYGWIPVHYRAMLAAAPTTPVQQDDEALEVLRELVEARSEFTGARDPQAIRSAAQRVRTADSAARSLLAKREEMT